MVILALSACQSVDTRDSADNEQGLKSDSLSTVSLLSTIPKQDALVLTAADEGQAQHVLEMNYTQQPTTWLVGQNQTLNLTMVPVRTYQQPSGIDCRDYTIEIAQKNGMVTEAACRYGENQWKLISDQKVKQELEQGLEKEIAKELEQKAIVAPDYSESVIIAAAEKEAATVYLESEIIATPEKGTTTVYSESEIIVDTKEEAEPTSKSIQNSEVEQYFLALEQAANMDNSVSPIVEEKTENKVLVDWTVQVASFSKKDNADRLVTQLEGEDYAPYIAKAMNTGIPIYRVVIDVAGSRQLVEEKSDQLKQQFGLSPFFFRTRKP